MYRKKIGSKQANVHYFSYIVCTNRTVDSCFRSWKGPPIQQAECRTNIQDSNKVGPMWLRCLYNYLYTGYITIYSYLYIPSIYLIYLDIIITWADPGMGVQGVCPPPPFGPRCRLFNIGVKIGPPPGPPFFACRPKMDPPPPFKILDPPLHYYRGSQ